MRMLVVSTMYNKTIIEFSFCDILNNQGLGKCNQPHKNLIQLLYSSLWTNHF